LFSNSVMQEDENGLLCVRDMFWKNSMHGLNPKNVGMFEHNLKSETELFQYIKQTSLYCIMRNRKYINFPPLPVMEYFNRSRVTGEFWNGTAYESLTFEPIIEDLQYLRTFRFEDLTFRGTIEFPSCCCQPIADSMTVAAFRIGLCETLEELKALLDGNQVLFGHGMTVSGLRKTFCRGEMPEFMDAKQLQLLVLSILHIARKGLEKRGFDETHFLEPLYNRTLQKKNPAITYLEDLSNGVTINELIQRYAKIG
jgi:glutamate--cysteine ligase